MDKETLTNIVLIAGPLLGVLGFLASLITIFRQARKDKSDNSVNKQEANTHEFDAMRQGFVDQMAELRKQLSDARDEAREDREEAARKHTELADRVHTLETERHEILQHVKLLENLIPDPPGVPMRPQWR